MNLMKDQARWKGNLRTGSDAVAVTESKVAVTGGAHHALGVCHGAIGEGALHGIAA